MDSYQLVYVAVGLRVKIPVFFFGSKIFCKNSNTGDVTGTEPYPVR